MSTYFLSRDVYHCEADGGAIFLDLGSGKYFGVNPQYLPQLRRAVKGWPRPPNCEEEGIANKDFEEIARTLTERGILTRSEIQGKAASAPAIRVGNSIGYGRMAANRSPIRWIDINNFIASFVHVTVNLRLFGVEGVIRRFESRKVSAQSTNLPRGETGVEELVRRFNRIRLWIYSAKDTCLADSLTLADFLLRYRVAPTLAIGIATKPFAAHAWVQIDDIVLNDTADNARRYTPILAI